MSIRLFSLLPILLLFCACAPQSAIQAILPNSPETSTLAVVSEAATPEFTPTAPPDLSYKVAAFYYPWYGNPTTDSQWIHWTQNNHLPPEDIASDYYPALGPYSSNDPEVVSQHL